MQASRIYCSVSFSVLALTFVTGGARAQEAVSVPASLSSVIQSDGPKQGKTADRFFNVEGKEKGKYACYGVLRFDLAGLKSSLDKKYGAGKYRVTGVSLLLTQSNAAFTGNGAVKFYFTPDDNADAKAKTSPLKYPYNPNAAALKGTLLATNKFAKGSPTAYDLFKAQTANGDFARHIAQGRTLTLVVSEGDDAVAATWAGQKPSETLKPPTLLVKAAPIGK